MSEQQRGSAGLKAAATGTDTAQRAVSIFTYLDNPKVKAGLAAVAPRYLQPERIMRLYVNVVNRTPDLMKCDAKTVLGAFMTTTALGLEPNTVQQLAWLLPYRRRMKVGNQWIDGYECQYQIGARGFVTLYYRNPQVLQVTAGAIHEGDHWKHMKGSNSFLEYAEAMANRGPLIGSFSHVKFRDGGESACVLPLDEIYKIRERSETYRALVGRVEKASDDKERQTAEKKLAETPWMMWEDEMATKSATKRHAKLLPIAASDSALMAASEIDGRGDVRKIDLRSMADPDVVRSVINDGFDPPEPETIEDEEEERSNESFGTRERSEQQADADGAQAAQVEEKKADEWKPSPEQLQAIKDREAAEAAAKEPKVAPPAPAPQRRTRPVGGLE